jgi:small subunit ribosomal protein S6
MRLADDVIRYMTIKLEPEAIEEDAEAIPSAEEPIAETVADVVETVDA